MAASAVNFVHGIEQYPCLYNNKLQEYSRKDITDRAWSEVAQKTNTSVNDCQIKWRNIRNGFVRSLKQTPSGSYTKQKKIYYLHEELQFVLPFDKAIVHTGEPGNIPAFSEVNTARTNETVSNSSANGEPSDTSTITLETPSSEAVSNTWKKTKVRKIFNEADKAFVDWIKKKEIKKDSARKMFLLSLLEDVKNLSEEQMRKFRIKVLLLLEDIQSEEPHQPQQSDQYRNYLPTQQDYRNNYSPISSVESNSYTAMSPILPVSPVNYSINTNEHFPELHNFENL